jgi:lysophospholipase L1-like esterase
MQVAGQWGIAMDNGAKIDNLKISRLVVDDSISAPQQVKLGDSIDIDIYTEEAQTVVLSDGGAGGTFSQNPATMDGVSNELVSYTPARVGSVTITATFRGGVETADVFVAPFSTNIGFIGNSITAASGGVNSEIAIIGGSATNMGVSGSRIRQWGTGSSNLNTALAAFQSNGVEVVQIMHGTNDARTSGGTTPEDYADYLGQIITELKSIGVKRIILNTSPYPKSVDTLENSYGPLSLELLAAYDDVMRAAVDGETVFLGDTEAYSLFEQNKNIWFADGLHPNATGYTELGQLWAAAYDRVIIEPIDMAHGFTGLTGDEYIQNGSTGLEYTIDKDAAWFTVASGNFANVLVDNAVIDPSNYTVASGSTVITLAPAYLNTLAIGTHDLTVRFTDGVSFSDTFTILAANTGGNTDGGANGNNTGGNMTAPVTGLFGLDKDTTLLFFSLMATVSLIGAVLLGRKLLTKRS